MLTSATFFSALLKTTLLKSDGVTVKNSYREKLLAVHFDDQLFTLKSYVKRQIKSCMRWQK